eukprot:TRINITY_DN4961_c0_g1_i1.p1 TRINITY_DN4961_c0_g1~~TRINITY_DN4961_c0_g1_i1.p1  ORF type:complete len:542 (+),score=112.55 TRINITY_DN4961_c0_g1_i1:59-1627(+)
MSSQLNIPFNLKESQPTEGFLYKLEKSITRSWKRRWVVLYDTSLYYFKTKPKKGKAELQGIVNLVHVVVDGEDIENHPHSFTLTSPERSWYFQAEQALTKKEWLIAIAKVVPDEGGPALQFDDRDVLNGIKMVYNDHLSHLEEEFLFHDFHSLPLKGVDFHAKPMVLLIGQYSVGKTSFIEYMIQQNFPGMRIGPEPTTDRFVAVMHDENERIIPGSALSVDPDRPFSTLNSFGEGFLSRFEGALCNSELLKHVTFIDTPGILSGSKQRQNRSYDFTEIISWFAERADMILLLFDAYKLDISDEFKDAIDVVSEYHDKIRVVLNKANQISPSKLMKVYGALMWSLGKVITTPEVLRVYIGSFCRGEENEGAYAEELKEWLFDSEREELLRDIFGLKRNATVMKVNALIKRIKLLKTHVCILDYLRDKMPNMFGQKKAAKGLIRDIEDHYPEIAKIHNLPLGDFPDSSIYQEMLPNFDMSKLPKIRKNTLTIIDEILSKDLPKFINMVTTQVSFGEEMYFDLH